MLTDIFVLLGGRDVPGADFIVLAELDDLLGGHRGGVNIALVGEKYDRYARSIGQRDLLPQIAQPFFYRLKRCHSRYVENEGCGDPEMFPPINDQSVELSWM